MNPMLELYLPGAPTPKGRGRATRTGRVFTPAATRKAEDTLAGRVMAKIEALDDGMRAQLPFAGPLSVTVHFGMPVPTSWSQRKRLAALGGTLRPTSKPDLDNLLKLVSDALNGVAWVDDSQIVQLVSSKAYSATPGVRLLVESIAEELAVAA